MTFRLPVTRTVVDRPGERVSFSDNGVRRTGEVVRQYASGAGYVVQPDGGGPERLLVPDELTSLERSVRVAIAGRIYTGYPADPNHTKRTGQEFVWTAPHGSVIPVGFTLHSALETLRREG